MPEDVFNSHIFEFARRTQEVVMCWKGCSALIAEMEVLDWEHEILGSLSDEEIFQRHQAE